MGIFQNKNHLKKYSNYEILRMHKSIMSRRPSSVWYNRDDRKMIREEIEKRKHHGTMKHHAGKYRRRSQPDYGFGALSRLRF